MALGSSQSTLQNTHETSPTSVYSFADISLDLSYP